MPSKYEWWSVSCGDLLFPCLVKRMTFLSHLTAMQRCSRIDPLRIAPFFVHPRQLCCNSELGPGFHVHGGCWVFFFSSSPWSNENHSSLVDYFLLIFSLPFIHSTSSSSVTPPPSPPHELEWYDMQYVHVAPITWPLLHFPPFFFRFFNTLLKSSFRIFFLTSPTSPFSLLPTIPHQSRHLSSENNLYDIHHPLMLQYSNMPTHNMYQQQTKKKNDTTKQ